MGDDTDDGGVENPDGDVEDHDGQAADGPPRVLVVEDEADVRRLYATWLEDEYEVVTAESGERALDLLDDSFDVVLLDRRMPGLHGDETLGRIRESGTDVRVARYDDRVRRYYAVTQKQAALDDADPSLERSTGYRELVRRRESLERGLDDLRDRLDDADYELLFRGLEDVTDVPEPGGDDDPFS